MRYHIITKQVVTYTWVVNVAEDEDPEEAARSEFGNGGVLDPFFESVEELEFCVAPREV